MFCSHYRSHGLFPLILFASVSDHCHLADFEICLDDGGIRRTTFNTNNIPKPASVMGWGWDKANIRKFEQKNKLNKHVLLKHVCATVKNKWGMTTMYLSQHGYMCAMYQVSQSKHTFFCIYAFLRTNWKLCMTFQEVMFFWSLKSSFSAIGKHSMAFNDSSLHAEHTFIFFKHQAD